MTYKEYSALKENTQVLLVNPVDGDDKAVASIIKRTHYSVRNSTPYIVSAVKVERLGKNNPYGDESMWKKLVGKETEVHFSLVRLLKV